MKANRADRVPVPGPLTPAAAGFKGYLAGLGYRSGCGSASLMAELSVWMSSEDLEPSCPTRGDWERFATRRRFASSLARKRWDGSASVLLECLGGSDALPASGHRRARATRLGWSSMLMSVTCASTRGTAARSVRNQVEMAGTVLSVPASATAELDL